MNIQETTFYEQIQNYSP